MAKSRKVPCVFEKYHGICIQYHLKTPLLLINRNRLLIYCIELWYCEWLPISLTCMQCYRPRLNLHYIDWHRHGNPMPVRSSPTYILQTFLTNRSKKENFYFIAPSIYYFHPSLVYSQWSVSSYPSPFILTSWLVTSWETSPAVSHEVVHACERHPLARRLWCFKAIVSDSLKAVKERERNSAFIFFIFFYSEL